MADQGRADNPKAVPEPLRREQQLAAVGQLTADFAHNLNNLITSILGNLALARSALTRGDSPEASLDGIQQAARDAGDAARALLSFARGSDGDWRPIDLGKLAQRALRLLRLPSQVRVSSHVSPAEPVFVQGDPAMLELAIVNLMLLARGSMASGGRLSIDVRSDPAASDGQAAAARVVHTVSGDLAREIAMLLEVEDAGTASLASGGLELLVAQAIAREHGGHIEIAARGQDELQIELRLPRIEMDERITRLTGSDEPAQIGAGRRVLLVEPHRHIGQLVASALRHVGFEVDVVASPAEASSRLIATGTPQAIVLDLAAEDRQWFETVRSGREQVPFVVIDRDPAAGGYSPAVERVAVPFRMFELADAVDRAISRQRPEAGS